MPLVSVALPAPWWTALTYSCDRKIEQGVRVRVPLGESSRVGIVVDTPSSDAPAEIKNIAEIIDEKSVLPAELLNTIKYFSENWFVGMGTAAKCLLPSAFFEGAELPVCESAQPACKSKVRYFYEPRDDKRYEKYLAQAKEMSGTLFLFPEVALAKHFWELLPEDLRQKGLLFPATKGKRQKEAWKSAATGEISFIVGSPSAAFVPLKGLSRIVVDEEESGAWQTQKYPVCNFRSLLAVRAKFAGAQLWLGGRMPSSKAAMKCTDESETLQKRIVFVDMWDSSSLDLKGLKDGVPISRPLLRETIRAAQERKFVFWLLDRRGFAGEIFCEDCGNPLRCKKCGCVMRWEAKKQKLVCLGCAQTEDLPKECPVCRGAFLEAVRPGLEAVHEKAQAVLKKHGITDVLTFDEKMPQAADIAREHPNGAVIIGTRKLLTLMSELECGVAGWIDADAEARGEDYDAKERAFKLIWESAWRGINADTRTIVIQSRRPGRDWQEGLKRGWKFFWNEELENRRAFEFPPFVPLLEIAMPKNRGKSFSQQLEKNKIEYIEGSTSDSFLVRTKRFALLRKILAGYYEIKDTHRGTPKVLLKLN